MVGRSADVHPEGRAEATEESPGGEGHRGEGPMQVELMWQTQVTGISDVLPCLLSDTSPILFGSHCVAQLSSQAPGELNVAL